MEPATLTEVPFLLPSTLVLQLKLLQSRSTFTSFAAV